MRKFLVPTILCLLDLSSKAFYLSNTPEVWSNTKPVIHFTIGSTYIVPYHTKRQHKWGCHKNTAITNVLDYGKLGSLKADVELPHTLPWGSATTGWRLWEVQEQQNKTTLLWTASKGMCPSVLEGSLPEDVRFVLTFIVMYLQLKKQISIWKSSEVIFQQHTMWTYLWGSKYYSY